MVYNFECFILQLSKREWEKVFDELYLTRLSQLAEFGYEEDDRHPPGRYHFSTLNDLAQTCKAIRAMCLRRLYTYVDLSRRHSIFALADAHGTGGFFYRDLTRGHAARAAALVRAEPFAQTTSLHVHISSVWLMEEHLHAVGLHLPALKHLYVHVAVGQGGPLTDGAEECKLALLHIKRFLSSMAGLRLVSAGFWFTRSQSSNVGGQLGSSNQLSAEQILGWQPLMLGANLKKLLFFPHLYERAGLAPAEHGERMRFIPWPCALEELVMDAADFCFTDPVTWHGQNGLRRVKLSQAMADGQVAISAAGTYASLGLSIARAAPSWRSSLRELRLDGTMFDATCAQALGQLHSLDRLDVHPFRIDSDAALAMYVLEDDVMREAEERLETWRHNVLMGREMGREIVLIADREDTVHEGVFAHLAAGKAHDLLSLLKMCLPSLENLRTLHVGSTHSCILEDRETFYDTAGFLSQLAIICPTLRFLHCGPHGMYHGCHVHVAVSCACNEGGEDGRPALAPVCAQSLVQTCGTRTCAL